MAARVCGVRAAVLGMLACAACAGSPAAEAPTGTQAATESSVTTLDRPSRSEVERGYASWYGQALAGHRTANGGRFDPSKFTAAHRHLPFGTWVEVRRVDTGGSVRVQITDRGPFGHDERIIDLSRAAAQRLGFLRAGVAPVELRVVEAPAP
jgi:rare lipoprotein A